MTIFVVPVVAGDETHVIEELNFIIQGGTRERSIRRFVDVAEGDTFSSAESLEDRLQGEVQDLLNYRVYEAVDVSREILRTEGDITYWSVTYEVVDAFTFIPIPYPKYSTSSGFRLAIQTDYANAFGTLTDINLNVGFNLEPINGSPTITRWNFTPEWGRIRLAEKITMVATADLSLRNARYTSGDEETQYWYSYYRTGLGVTFTFRLPQSWYYRISPYFDFRFSYKDVQAWGNFEEEPFNFAFKHAIGWGRVNWQGNFRKGHSYALTHHLRYVYSGDSDERKLTNELDFKARWYVPIGPWLNFYSRLGGFYMFNDVKSGAGSFVRGVSDYDLSGELGFYLQNSLALQFWRWEGVWDAQIHPFFDIGMAGNIGEINADEHLKYGAGVDLVLYLDKVPSMVARATIGFNLSDQDLTGLGEKLEIDITSTLSY